jgi:hypothetical protein
MLVGPVVASLATDRERRAHLCVYPVSRDLYPRSAQDDFQGNVLPNFRGWLRAKKSSPETAILGHYQIIAEWTGREHRRHELRFL